MERTDYIEKREDIISNIETLYSYLHGESGEDYKQWAVDKLKRGKNMVVEVIDGHICFAPSRFVGYLNKPKISTMKIMVMALIPIKESICTIRKWPMRDLMPLCKLSYQSMRKRLPTRSIGFQMA